MIRYTVVWHKQAEDELEEIWLRSKIRTEVTKAANEVDRQLQLDAQNKGDFVALDIFEIRVHPLKVLFRVSEQDRLVAVLHIVEI